MCYSDKSYYSIQLSKDNFLELEDILTNNFTLENTRKSFSIKTPKKNIPPSTSMYDLLLNEKAVQTVESVSIEFIGSEKSSGIRQLTIYISNVFISVYIKGEDEVWVNGMAKILEDFFKERESIILKTANLIPYFAGGLIGTNISIGLMALFYGKISIAVLSAILLLFGLVLKQRDLVRKVLPAVKFSLVEMPKRDWNTIAAIVTIIGTPLGIFITLIALLISF